MPNSGRPPAREGISPRKTVLRGYVPEKGEYFAARAGDSPYPLGALLPAGAALPRPVPGSAAAPDKPPAGKTSPAKAWAAFVLSGPGN